MITRKLQIIIITAIVCLGAILRFYHLASNPPGLYWDETVFGYDAYSILKTGHDHHGKFLPIFFESFGDWKLPGYHYLLVPSIFIFGLSEFAVRFPSAFLGTLTVLVFFFLIKNLLENSKKSEKVSFLITTSSTLMLAISPWHIQFSRGGFESTAGLFFVVSGVLFFVLGIKKGNSILLTFSFLLLTFSMYTYHAYRIFTPAFGVALAVLYRKEVLRNVRKLIIPCLVAFVILIPLLRFSLTPEGKARALSQTTFNAQEAEIARVNFDQNSKKPFRFLSRYLKKETYFSSQAIENYVKSFSPSFLFIRGDQIGRHSQVDMGQIYIFDAILILLGLFTIRNLHSPKVKLMLFWLLLAPLPAIIVNPNPHAYRTLQMSIPLAFLSGLGVYAVFSYTKNKKKYVIISAKIILIAIIVHSFFNYIHLVHVHYPRRYSIDWQDGYREMVRKTMQFQNSYDEIFVTKIDQVPYIYFLFYGKYDPQKFIDSKGTDKAFDKYRFIDRDTDIFKKEKVLYVAPSWEKIEGKWLAAVDDSNGRHLYSLWELGTQYEK